MARVWPEEILVRHDQYDHAMAALRLEKSGIGLDFWVEIGVMGKLDSHGKMTFYRSFDLAQYGSSLGVINSGTLLDLPFQPPPGHVLLFGCDLFVIVLFTFKPPIRP